MEHLEKPLRLQPKADFGLSRRQVQEQMAKGLVNTKPKSTEKTVLEIIRDNTITLFNLFNATIALCVFLVGAYRNLLFMALIITNTFIGIVQEIRSKRLVAKLSLISMPRIVVLREGVQTEIAVEELVQDDVMVLESGRQIGADALVLDGEIEVNEALLTGEADAILKRKGDMLLSGSFVTSGRCLAKVEHIGLENYAASIEMDAKQQKKNRSELLDTLNQVVKFTGVFILPLGALLWLRSYFLLHLSIHDSVVTTAAAVLGMMPKGLVLLTSMSLMVGVIRLAKRKTLIHELFGIETLSRVDMLCLDKTGTLTEGNMQVSEWIPLCDMEENSILDLIGAFVHTHTDSNATINAIRQYFKGEPSTDAHKLIPFSSARRFSAILWKQKGAVWMGAPDALWPTARGEMPVLFQAYQDEGARVLLFATSKEHTDEPPEDIQPCAAVVLRDPIRHDAGEILQYFFKQGVAIKVISGDHPLTLSAIAKKVGLANAEKWIDLSSMGDEREIEKAALEYTIFGRVNPQQKRLLIQALKRANHTVAMMGDGVNDVLALREADCSVTIASGTDAARNISHIVLLDNNFASLPAVVMEGRRVVNNIRRTASLYLVKTVYSFLISFITVFSAIRYPYIPIQLTLIGVLMEGIPSFILALEPNDERIDRRFFPTVLKSAVPYGFVIATLVALCNIITKPLGLTHAQIGTLCVYLTGAFCSMLLYEACRPFNALRMTLWIAMTAAFIVTTALLPHVFLMQRLNGLLALLMGIFIVTGTAFLYVFKKLVARLMDWHLQKKPQA